MSVLGKMPIKAGVRAEYQEQLRKFDGHAAEEGMECAEAEELDCTLMALMNMVYLSGEPAWGGNTVLAVVMFHRSGVPRLGAGSLPGPGSFERIAQLHPKPKPSSPSVHAMGRDCNRQGETRTAADGNFHADGCQRIRAKAWR